MNPFKDWTVEQQCKEVYAKGRTGITVKATSNRAVQWCAWGRLEKFNTGLEASFSDFFFQRYGNSIVWMNDERGWTPQMFETAWNNFESERTQ